MIKGTRSSWSSSVFGYSRFMLLQKAEVVDTSSVSVHSYHFVTRWNIRDSGEEIFRILRDGAGYSRWWPAYRVTEEIGPRQVQVEVRAPIGYRLRFMTELVREDPPHELEIRSSGDLKGRGLWKLRQEGPFTRIEFYWDVSLEKRPLRWLAPLLRPVFKWNHDWVMRQGEKGLQKELTGVQFQRR